MLKAPAILSVSSKATSPLARAILILCTRYVIRSKAVRLGNALKYYFSSFLYLSASRETLLIRSLFNPFPIYNKSEISLYPLYVVYAFLGFPGLGIIMTLALLKGRGW